MDYNYHRQTYLFCENPRIREIKKELPTDTDQHNRQGYFYL